MKIYRVDYSVLEMDIIIINPSKHSKHTYTKPAKKINLYYIHYHNSFQRILPMDKFLLFPRLLWLFDIYYSLPVLRL